MYSVALIINLYVSNFDLVQWSKFTNTEFSYFALLRRNNFFFCASDAAKPLETHKKMTIIEIE